MKRQLVFDDALTRADRVVLGNLAKDIECWSSIEGTESSDASTGRDSGLGSDEGSSLNGKSLRGHDVRGSTRTARDVARLKASRDPTSSDFDPTVFQLVDDWRGRFSPAFTRHVLEPYVRQARKVARHPTDVVMITHLIIYFTTLVPSAILLYRRFHLLHGLVHAAMQAYFCGTYTLMMHQHIHQRGILAKRFSLVDRMLPYILDPMMGHTWNSYFYHHVKHHHVENNGPDDLSSTLRYQRDSVGDFLRYVGRFYFFVWLDLPLYFLRKKRPGMAARAAGGEYLTFAFYATMGMRFGWKPTIFVYIIPLLLMRVGLMIGNWGQHAFVDADDPDSDFRSSITLIDVASNRFCFNDGYHTSHHLNPLRHWRDHPISLLQQKHTYASEGALVFHDIDFLMITFRLLQKNYRRLAECMVPLGSQIDLTMDERIALLKTLTRRFSEDEIRQKFPHRKS
ncbi:hypothetical protein HIM_04698 [Hirsutella minnesotensis 3608]|uniref:Fatty acid desaturase domain-containing protein n=1 Tax=Hirsutella minnesotensis 3608 TaxID=1043627 RepID=A0A0F8A5T2_9HYPO|nr:hypothetical protein HIM_04698 [Hirsutella minnesotensis 3608]